MIPVLTIQGVALVVLLVCSAFFSSAETALFSLNPVQIHRLRRANPRAADGIEALLAMPTRVLSAILIGNTLVNMTAAGIGFLVAERFWPALGEVISIPVMTVVLLLFGEVTPKRFAMPRAVWLACLYAPVFRILIPIMAPLHAVLDRITGLFKKELQERKRTLTADEFLTAVKVGEEEGVLNEDERTMLNGILRLEEMQASEVMTPRVDVIAIDLGDSPAAQEQVARSVRSRYVPVYRRSLDEAEGFLDVPRFLLGKDRDLRAALIPPLFVPETISLDRLLATFQKENRQIAFVTDEFGGTAGLITLVDILEQIVTDVQSEYDDENPDIQSVGEDRWLIDGGTRLDAINEALKVSLSCEGVERIAGWVGAIAGRIPRMGEVVEAQGCRVSVQRIRQRRVTLVLLEKMPPSDGGGATP